MMLRTPHQAHQGCRTAQRRVAGAAQATALAPARRSVARRRTAANPAAALPELPDATTIAYWSIGAGAVSFALTFGVAPLFKKNFKEDVDWKAVYQDLVAGGGVPSVTPAAAYAKRKSAVLVDVRLGLKYEAGHPEGAASVPLYLPIQSWDPASIIRRLGFSFFGIYGTQLNKDFSEDAAAAIPKGKEVILVCENGGSLDNKPGTLYGFQSRSLKAAYYLRRAGFNRISYVQGGVSRWTSEGLPIVAGGGDDGGAAEAPRLKLPSLSLARRR
ncbi:MAG: Rhodanese-like domain-containing protein [Monoraphidium minutum]|nr:MAG: Rhodanese-like domain-containing protein [Monoraphidium minutum]